MLFSPRLVGEAALNKPLNDPRDPPFVCLPSTRLEQGVAITRRSTLLIDDDPKNIAVALSSGVKVRVLDRSTNQHLNGESPVDASEEHIPLSS